MGRGLLNIFMVTASYLGIKNSPSNFLGLGTVSKLIFVHQIVMTRDHHAFVYFRSSDRVKRVNPMSTTRMRNS